MQFSDEYTQMYYEKIKKKLSPSFVTMYEQNDELHDWYLKNIYIANTGTRIQAYSSKGSSTLQMEFETSGNDKNILLIYKNVFDFHVDFSIVNGVTSFSPTGFGRCTTNVFKIDDDAHICHNFVFEDGTISITCNSVDYRRIIDNYW